MAKYSDDSVEMLYEEPYVVIYGRSSCGWTDKYIKDLKEEGLDPIYESVDSKKVCDELHLRMEEAGLDTGFYNLPVIDVNGQMFIRPELERIIEIYDQSEET